MSNVKDLLAPISKAAPAGDDLRYDPLYDEIRELRREEDSSLPQGVWETKSKTADWKGVRKAAEEALAKRSKDLQIAVWLTEALLHTDGVKGCAQGVELLARLCDRFWAELWPQIEDGDLDARLAPIWWLDEKLPLSLAQMPLTNPPPGQQVGYTWQNWANAQRLEALAVSKPKEFKAAVGRGDVSVAMFTAAVTATPDSVYTELKAGLQGLAEAVRRLRGVLDKKCESQAPSLSRLSGQIGDMLGLVERTLGDRGMGGETAGLPAPVAAPPARKEEHVEGVAETPLPGAGGIRSRQEAYALLNMAANYLLATEPHSPTPYLVKRAVTWGNMPLSELLAELLEDNSDLSKIYRLLNMQQR